LNNADRKIVFVNQVAGYLVIDILNVFIQSKKFNEVGLITGSLNPLETPLDKRIRITKIRGYYRGHAFIKAVSWLISTYQIFKLLKKKFPDWEIVFFTVPPTAYLLSALLPNRFSLVVYDVYPDVIEATNFRNLPFVIKLWRNLNCKIFAKALRIYTLTEKMANLLGQYTSRNDIIIIPNWSMDTANIAINAASNPTDIAPDLLENFIILYAGNIGLSISLNIILEIAKVVNESDDIQFLIMGNDKRLEYLKKELKKRSFGNIKILPFQNQTDFIQILAKTDLGLVITNENNSDVSFPSKLYNLQANKIPIIGIGNKGSELEKHLNKYRNGKCFESKDIEDITKYVNKIIRSPILHTRLKQNSKKASTEFMRKNAKIYIDNYLKPSNT
jgi:UDP-N-acetylglucosamine:LPS N-acetylglucosamine transferase